MKDYYQITEVAKLYGLCPDTLRYYEEQGLLHPRRSESGYRLYSIDDICNLNVIRALRTLDMPVEHMRQYFESQRVETTLHMLDEQDEIIRQRIGELRSVRRSVEARRQRLSRYAAQKEGELQILELAERPCLLLQENVILEQQIDFALKKLAHRHENLLRSLGTHCMGAVLDEEKRLAGDYTHYRSVFYLGCKKQDADGRIDAGTYASTFYKGEYRQLNDVCTQLFAQLETLGYLAKGPVMELYHIDAHDTADPSEYLTEVQLRIQKKPEADDVGFQQKSV